MGIRIKIDINVYDMNVDYVDSGDLDKFAVDDNDPPTVINSRVELLSELLGIDYEDAERLYMEHRQ